MSSYQHALYSKDYSVLQSVESNINSISIHKNAKTIKGISSINYAFSSCANTVETVLFEDESQLTEISPYSFYQCIKLRQIDLTPCNFLTKILDFAFFHCKSLSSIKLPNSVLILGVNLLENTNISEFTFPSSVTIIPYKMFAYCSNLAKIEIPVDSNITTIEKWIVRDTKLQSFNIPSKVNSITYGFVEYSNLESISVSPQNGYFKVENYILIQINQMIAHSYPPKKGGPVIFPNDILNSMSAAFSRCGITSITFSSNLKSIHDYCFQYNPITEIEIPDSVTSMGNLHSKVVIN